MKIVINISDKLYEDIKKTNPILYTELEKCIANGTPLPTEVPYNDESSSIHSEVYKKESEE